MNAHTFTAEERTAAAVADAFHEISGMETALGTIEALCFALQSNTLRDDGTLQAAGSNHTLIGLIQDQAKLLEESRREAVGRLHPLVYAARR